MKPPLQALIFARSLESTKSAASKGKKTEIPLNIVYPNIMYAEPQLVIAPSIQDPMPYLLLKK